MSRPPTVSLVIPTRDRPRLLRRALRSALTQTRVPDEIWVVDDGSEEPVAAGLAKDFPQVRCHRQEPGGVSSARNAGANLSQSEWIAFLDDDDEWLPDKLARQLAHAAAHPRLRFVHCDEIWIRNGKVLPQKEKHRKRGGWIFADCLPFCRISPSAVLLRKDLYVESGGFDESLLACEDYDLWLRICAREPVGFVEEVLLRKHGGHAGQLSRRHWGMDRFRIRSLAKCLRSGVLGEDQSSLVGKELERKIRIYLRGAEKHGQTLHVEEFSGWLRDLEQGRFPRAAAPIHEGS